jgi:competence protein ComFC
MLLAELLTAFIDTLFPPREDERVVRELTLDVLQELYQPHTKDGWTTLSSFKDTRVRALVHQAKYERDANAQKLLGKLLARHIDEHLEMREAVWVPIPLSPARLRARGYNQVTEVLAHSGLPFVHDALVRTHDTKPQTTLTKAERLVNMENVFAVVRPESITGKDVVILDDVVTTGATLRSAKNALGKHAPKSITLLALAH